jgi:hypothetical protein
VSAKRSEVPVACSLSAGRLSERRAAWARLDASALRDYLATDTGVRLVYTADTEVERELRELSLLEAECCAFAEWKVTRHGGELVLDVRAEGAGIPAVRSIFAVD